MHQVLHEVDLEHCQIDELHITRKLVVFVLGNPIFTPFSAIGEVLNRFRETRFTGKVCSMKNVDGQPRLTAICSS